MKNILGLDPGLSGGVALYDGNELLVWAMPTFEISNKTGKKTNHIDVMNLLKIFKDYHIHHAYLEQAWPRPGDGGTGSFKSGVGYGEIKATLQCAGVPMTIVSPQAWKKELEVPKDKDAARHRASQLLPTWAHCWSRKKDDGIAEASLIALYGFNK